MESQNIGENFQGNYILALIPLIIKILFRLWPEGIRIRMKIKKA